MAEDFVTKSEHSAVREDVSDLKSKMTALTTNVNNLTDSISTMHENSERSFSTIHQKLDRQSANISSMGKINPSSIAAVIAIIGLLGSLAVLHTRPIAVRAEENHDMIVQRLSQLPGDYEEFGRLQQKVVRLLELPEQVQAIDRETERNRVAIHYIEEKLFDVDRLGSRVWTKGRDTSISKP